MAARWTVQMRDGRWGVIDETADDPASTWQPSPVAPTPQTRGAYAKERRRVRRGAPIGDHRAAHLHAERLNRG